MKDRSTRKYVGNIEKSIRDFETYEICWKLNRLDDDGNSLVHGKYPTLEAAKEAVKLL